MTRVYYRSTDVVITDEVFAIRGPVAMWFRLDRLRDAHIVRNAPPVRVLNAGGLVVLPILAVVAGSQFDSLWGKVTAVLVAAVPFAVLAVRHRRAARTYELRARYGERDVTLFRSTDAVRFGQVRRALSRALDSRVDVVG